MSRFGDGYLYAKRELTKPAGKALQGVECAKDTFDEFDEGVLKAMSYHVIVDAELAIPVAKRTLLKHNIWLLVMVYLIGSVGSFDAMAWTIDQRTYAVIFYAICVWLRIAKEYL